MNLGLCPWAPRGLWGDTRDVTLIQSTPLSRVTASPSVERSHPVGDTPSQTPQSSLSPAREAHCYHTDKHTHAVRILCPRVVMTPAPWASDQLLTAASWISACLTVKPHSAAPPLTALNFIQTGFLLCLFICVCVWLCVYVCMCVLLYVFVGWWF